MSVIKISPRQAKQYLIETMQTNLVPFLWGDPGTAKSSIAKEIANEFNLELIDIRLSTVSPEDFTGLPRSIDGFSVFQPFKEIFPLEGYSEPPKGKQGWILFLDEMNSAPRSIIAAAYKLILDRMVGHNYHLDSRVVIMAAGNESTNRAITVDMGTAMQSRLIHFEIEPNAIEWIEDYAIPNKFDSRIIAYISQYPEKLHKFDPNHADKTFACMRTWEFLNRIIKNYPEGELPKNKLPLLAGIVSADVAAEFIEYSNVFNLIPSFEDILKNPGMAIPTELNLQWASISNIISKFNKEHFTKLTQYIDKFDTSFKILFYRSILVKDPSIRLIPEFSGIMQKIQSYLND